MRDTKVSELDAVEEERKDERGEVSLVVDELLLLVVDDVGADGVEESRVVGHDHGGDLRLGAEVCKGSAWSASCTSTNEGEGTHRSGAMRRTEHRDGWWAHRGGGGQLS